VLKVLLILSQRIKQPTYFSEKMQISAVLFSFWSA